MRNVLRSMTTAVREAGDLMQDAVKKSAVAEAAWKENKANPTTKEGEGS